MCQMDTFHKLKLRNRRLTNRRRCCLLEVFGYISFVIILLTDTNNDRTVILFILANNLIACAGTFQCLYVILNIMAVGFHYGIFT